MKSLCEDVRCEDVSNITISNNPTRVSSKGPIRITDSPKISPLIITSPGPIPYSSDKVVPWNYGVGVYYHGIKQDLLAIKNEFTEYIDPNIDNIVGTSKVTRSGRIFSPEISPKVVATPFVIPANTHVVTHVATPVVVPPTESAETQGKEVLVKPAHTEAPK